MKAREVLGLQGRFVQGRDHIPSHRSPLEHSIAFLTELKCSSVGESKAAPMLALQSRTVSVSVPVIKMSAAELKHRAY